MEDDSQKEKITSLHVSKLFGRFNYDLRFPESNDISIITAPNGYGKTVLLRIIDSIFNRKLHFFRKIDFREIKIELSSKKSIAISKTKGEQLTDDEFAQDVVLFKCFGFNSDSEEYTLATNLSPSDTRYLEHHLPVEQLDSNKWIDLYSDELLSTDEIITRYAGQLSDKLRKSLPIPEWLQVAISSIKVHFIETQRLLYLHEPDDRMSPQRRRATSSSVVEKEASDLVKRINRLLQEYANESQKLDQTFPKRILGFRDGKVSKEEKIRGDLEKLTQKRDDLVSVGLLVSSISEPISPSEIFQDENIRRILEIYVEDTSKKLDIFDETYEKIRLFKQILDERFLFKSIQIDPHKGIRAIDKNNGQDIPLAELSSGEQHELVLIYELLFIVEEESIILIDEPELSLHVTWQKNFIADIQKIQELKKLRVVIATHSPQIIHDKWDLVEELKV